jgi:TM2 domain-containing membrane protein YozV
MGKALVKHSGSAVDGAVPAIASAVIPGLGQLINGEGDKALGVFVIATLAGLGFWAGIPLIGGLAGLVAGVTWVYGVADGYVQGRRKG